MKVRKVPVVAGYFIGACFSLAWACIRPMIRRVDDALADFEEPF